MNDAILHALVGYECACGRRVAPPAADLYAIAQEAAWAERAVATPEREETTTVGEAMRGIRSFVEVAPPRDVVTSRTASLDAMLREARDALVALREESPGYQTDAGAQADALIARLEKAL